MSATSPPAEQNSVGMMTASSARQIGQSRTSTSPEDRGTRVLRSRRAKRCMRSAFLSPYENSQNGSNLSLLAGCTHTGRGLHTIPGCTAPHERSGSNPSPSKGCDRLCCIGRCRCPGDSGGMLRSQGRPAPAVASSAFTGFRFPTEIIVLAVRWYLRFGCLIQGASHSACRRPSGARGDAPMALGRLSGRPTRIRRALHAPPDGMAWWFFSRYSVFPFRRHASCRSSGDRAGTRGHRELRVARRAARTRGTARPDAIREARLRTAARTNDQDRRRAHGRHRRATHGAKP